MERHNILCHKLRNYVLATIILSISSFQSMAKEVDHVDCKNIEKVAVNKMGLVDEKMLQKRIDEMKNTLNKVKRKAARRGEHRKLLRSHLADMQRAMLDLHDLKLKSGCLGAEHGASIGARIMLIEKRLDVMQVTMEQMLGHQQEIERE